MTRGFVTIATGKLHYYKLAKNLLDSYRLFSPEPYPFAIICEEENRYTEAFDDVVITTESTHSFMDKFLLLKLCPYDETIFLDADSLAYGDLNKNWKLFENATDFSAPGANVPLDAETGAWYNVEDIGEYGKLISYKSRVHDGVCFIRKSERTVKMYEDCLDIYRNFDKLRFHSYPRSKDECIFGVAMPMNGMKAVRANPRLLAAYPNLTFLEADMLRGVLRYKAPWTEMIDDGVFLHWGTAQTFEPLYRYNERCLRYLVKQRAGQRALRPCKALLMTYYRVASFLHNQRERAKRVWKRLKAK